MEINSIHLHHIDLENEEVRNLPLDLLSANLNLYVNSLVEEIVDNPNKREYRFKDADTQVKNSLNQILNLAASDRENAILNNSKRLLEKEMNVQERINRLNKKIQKGSLLHIYFTSDELRNIIICKVEHDEVLNELTLDLNQGLNTKKKIFKAILLKFDGDGIVTENYLFDNHSSKFWWDDFLELEQIIKDDVNTERSVNAIDSALTPHKKKYYADYLILRNSFVGYFRTKDTFNFSEFVTDVFEKYEPVNIDFPIKDITKKVKELPKKRNFETQFGIVKGKVNKKIQHKIKLANNLFLSIDDYVVNLENIITPYQDEEGNKFIKIQTSEGYEKIIDLLK